MSSNWIYVRKNWAEEASSNQSLTQKNPMRGLYHVYTYDVTEAEQEEDWVWSLVENETLALVLLDIGKCADRALSEAELAKVGRIFSFFQTHHRQMIVRVVYDRLGHGMECEPRTLEQICQHIQQIAPFLVAYASDILTLQGLLIGSWGEMHDSHYLEKQQLQCLYDTLLRETAGAVCISVRKPQYQRLLQKSEQSDIGLYDDAILGSETDMGTFGWLTDVSNREIMWTPELEIEYIQKQARQVYCGGEILSGALALPWEAVLARMRQMQLTYVNRVHEPQVWHAWENAACPDLPGSSCLEYVRDHLGYRYVITGVCVLTEDSGQPVGVSVRIKNTGFACCYGMLRLELLIGEKKLQASFDGKMLAAGSARDISLYGLTNVQMVQTAMSERALPPKEYWQRMILRLFHVQTGLPIYFANGNETSHESGNDKSEPETYCCSSSSEEGITVGVLLTEKEAVS